MKLKPVLAVATAVQWHCILAMNVSLVQASHAVAISALHSRGICHFVTARCRRHHLSRTTRVWNVTDGAAQGRFGFWIARREKVLGFGVLDAWRGKVLVARRGKVLVARRGKVLVARRGKDLVARQGSGCAARKGSRCVARKGSAGSGCAA